MRRIVTRSLSSRSRHSVPWALRQTVVPIADVGHVEIEHGVAGSGHGGRGDPGPVAAPVVALHCSGASHREWSKLSVHLDGVAAARDGAPPAPRLCALNLFGYGSSSPWPCGGRPQRLDDHATVLKAVATATADALGGPRCQLLGHSMGGGIVLQTLAADPAFAAKVDSVVVFEPNLFSLLSDPRCNDGGAAFEACETFVESMLSHADGQRWDAWGRTFYDFWFEGAHIWDEKLDDSTKARLVQTTVPQTVHEITGLKHALRTRTGSMAAADVDALAALAIPKHVVLAAEPGKGSAQAMAALGGLLEAHAGFEVHSAPGGHMGPITHPDTSMAVLAELLVR